jgi:ubiquinone biosynthesis protein COQ9
MRFRDRVAHAVKLRLDLVEPHKEAVRRGATLFALPIHAADGARACSGKRPMRSGRRWATPPTI